MPASSPPVVVLGAGLTGLAAAYHLPGPCVVAERESSVGGHARTNRRGGYSFDVTGHWLHLRDPRIRRLVAEISGERAWVEVDRRTSIYTHGVRVPYPFQANLHGLPLEVVQECLVEFFAAREAAARGEQSPPRTFAEFAEARFGRGIARHFFIPYNRKLWGAAFDRLDASWVDRYVPTPSVAQIIGGAIGLPQEGLGYNARFLYPRAGGIDALPRGLCAAIESRSPGTIARGSEVEEIDVHGRRVKLSGDDEWRSYGALISTLPLPELISRISAAPPEIRAAAAALRWISWRYLDLASRRRAPIDSQWVYVPSPRLPFFRVGVYSNAVPSMAPPGASSIYVELADRRGPVDLAAVAEGLCEVGVLENRGDIVFTDLRKIEYAYVVFDDDHAPATATLHRWLASVGVRSCGRYGAWIYNSMEDSMIQGIEAAAWATSEIAKGSAR